MRVEEAVYGGDAEVDLTCARRSRVLAVQAAWGNASSKLAGDHLIANQPDEVVALVLLLGGLILRPPPNP